MRFGILIILLIMSLSSAIAQNLCWIDAVVRTPDGLAVMFVGWSSPRLVSLERAGMRVQPLETDLRATLKLKEGDVALIRQGHHDSCTLRVERRDDVVGLFVEARNRADGLPHTDASEFVVPK
jgi:hypothetical protein